MTRQKSDQKGPESRALSEEGDWIERCTLAFRALDRHAHKLSKMLQQPGVVHEAVVYKLPDPVDADGWVTAQGPQPSDGSQPIRVTSVLSGDRAVAVACELYSSFQRRNQPPGLTRRAAGVLALTDLSIIAAVNQLNELKLELEKQITSTKLGDHARRLRLSMSALGGVHLLHAYRKVRVLRPGGDNPVTRVSFTWSSNSRQVSRITKQQALDLLPTLPDGPSKWERLLRDVGEHEPLARVYSNVVTPLANLSGPHGLVGRPPAGLPFVFVGERLPDIRQLPDFVPASDDAQRPRRSDVRLQEPALIPALRLYRYLPEYRRSKRHRGPPPKTRGYRRPGVGQTQGSQEEAT